MLKETVGNNIRSRRRELGLTQTQLADQIGTVYRVINRYENGHTEPSFAIIEQLSQILGKPVSWFFSTHDEKEISVPLDIWQRLCQMYQGFSAVMPGADPLPPSLIQFEMWHDLTNHVPPLVVTSPPPDDLPGVQLATASSPIDPHSSWVECFSLPCATSAFAV